MNIPANAKLKYLNIGKYGGIYKDVADFSNQPRPYFSIGMILDGIGDFYEQNSDCINVIPGDIIIVPNAATYISYWSGTPNISYITFHFIFENGLNGNIPIQKICGYKHFVKDFCYAYDNFYTPEKSFKILSIFYNMLDEIFPKIKKSSEKHYRTSVKKAIDYITSNYTRTITIKELSQISNLSQSRFFPSLKAKQVCPLLSIRIKFAYSMPKKCFLQMIFPLKKSVNTLAFTLHHTLDALLNRIQANLPENTKVALKQI